MMTIKLKDRSEIVVTDEQGLKVQDSILKDAQFIKLEGQLYSRNSIDQVISGGQPPKPEDNWADVYRSVSAGKRCVGLKSIQSEINNIAKGDYGKNWAAMLVDREWREKTRLELRSLSDEWCDHYANECAC